MRVEQDCDGVDLTDVDASGYDDVTARTPRTRRTFQAPAIVGAMFLFPAFADELPAYTAARRASWSGDDAAVIAATEGLAGTSEDARRANLLRAAALLARGDDRGAGRAWREVVQGWPQDALSDAAYLDIATVYLSRRRTTEADVYARRVGPGPALGQALAVQAHAHLLEGEQGRGLGALIGAEGASPWFEPEAMAWGSRYYAAICYADEARAWRRRFERLAAIRTLGAPWLEHIDDARAIDPGFAAWLLADPEVASVVASVGEPGFREAAEVLLARRHAKALAHLDAAAAILGGKVRLPDGVSGWPDTWGTIPIDDTFNGELWADELDRYRFTGESRCSKD